MQTAHKLDTEQLSKPRRRGLQKAKLPREMACTRPKRRRHQQRREDLGGQEPSPHPPHPNLHQTQRDCAQESTFCKLDSGSMEKRDLLGELDWGIRAHFEVGSELELLQRTPGLQWCEFLALEVAWTRIFEHERRAVDGLSAGIKLRHDDGALGWGWSLRLPHALGDWTEGYCAAGERPGFKEGSWSSPIRQHAASRKKSQLRYQPSISSADWLPMLPQNIS